jgi:SAM-dependent methyltransferase
MSKLLNLEVVPPGPCAIDFEWYDEIRAHLLRRTVAQADRVLDVGCAQGDVLLMLAGQIGEGVGIDVNDDDLTRAEGKRQAQKAQNVTFRHADATALPFPGGSFDAVLLLGDVLTYIDPARHATVVAGLARVLKPEGFAVHGSMNWDWEYRWPYPPVDIAFTRSGEGAFAAHRTRRDASGLETSRDFEVVAGTPLHRWILEQEWPVCASPGSNVWLEVKELAPIPEAWLRPCGESQFRHYCPPDLERLYREAGFRRVERFCYGQTYDIVNRAGLIEQLAACQSALALAEAELAFTLRLGSGPWLLLIAHK